MWVYNRNSEGVRINISLKGNQFGIYKLNIDGQPSNSVRQKEIRGKDSILIFVQMYVQNNGSTSTMPFVVADQLLFETNGNTQDVDIVGWARVAHYFRDSVLGCNLHWTADTPYVIYESVLVPEGCTLTIDAGTHIYSHVKSSFLVAGTLLVNGTNSNPVIFEGDRLEADYTDVPGQWVGIRLLPSSRDNVIKNTVIKNAVVGVEVDSLSHNANPKLTITQSVVQNMLAYGIAGFTADLEAINNLVINCGQYSFIAALGGNYTIHHNTFAMYGTGFSRTTPTFVLDNSPFTDKDGNIIKAFPLNGDIRNNIIDGSQEDEMLLNTNASGGNTSGNINLTNCLIRTKEYSKLPAIADNNIVNLKPMFKDIAKNDFDIDVVSPAKNKGVNVGVTVDLIGRPRSSSTPSIGCFE